MKKVSVNSIIAVLWAVCLCMMLAACQNSDQCQEAFPNGIGYDNVNDQNVIIDGYDVVAFFKDKKPVKGSPDFQETYQGTIYYFSSKENQNAFLANPEKYRPQFGGWCAVAAARNHIQVISVDYFELLNGKLYLNHNANAKRIWDKNPQKIVRQGDKNWPCLLKVNGAPYTQERPLTTN